MLSRGLKWRESDIKNDYVLNHVLKNLMKRVNSTSKTA